MGVIHREDLVSIRRRALVTKPSPLSHHPLPGRCDIRCFPSPWQARDVTLPSICFQLARRRRVAEPTAQSDYHAVVEGQQGCSCRGMGRNGQDSLGCDGTVASVSSSVLASARETDEAPTPSVFAMRATLGPSARIRTAASVRSGVITESRPPTRP